MKLGTNIYVPFIGLKTQLDKRYCIKDTKDDELTFTTLIPYGIRNSQRKQEIALYKYLQEQKTEKGIKDIVDYVAKKINHNININDVCEKELLSYSQIIAVASAIRKLEDTTQRGRYASFILGDQMGLGKGRVIASIILYALSNNKKAIFITEKPNLFTDIFRDFVDVLQISKDDKEKKKELLKKLQFLIIASNKKEATISDPHERTEELKEGVHFFDKNSAEIRDFINRDDYYNINLPYKIILSTYSQFNKNISNEKNNFLTRFVYAYNPIIVLDECHNASGETSNTADFFKDLLEIVSHNDRYCPVLFSSGTFVKRGGNLDLYSYRNTLSILETPFTGTLATEESRDRMARRHGVFDIIDYYEEHIQSVLKTKISQGLIEDGQMIRRELSITPAQYITITDDKDELIRNTEQEKDGNKISAFKDLSDKDKDELLNFITNEGQKNKKIYEEIIDILSYIERDSIFIKDVIEECKGKLTQSDNTDYERKRVNENKEYLIETLKENIRLYINNNVVSTRESFFQRIEDAEYIDFSYVDIKFKKGTIDKVNIKNLLNNLFTIMKVPTAVEICKYRQKNKIKPVFAIEKTQESIISDLQDFYKILESIGLSKKIDDTYAIRDSFVVGLLREVFTNTIMELKVNLITDNEENNREEFTLKLAYNPLFKNSNGELSQELNPILSLFEHDEQIEKNLITFYNNIISKIKEFDKKALSSENNLDMPLSVIDYIKSLYKEKVGKKIEEITGRGFYMDIKIIDGKRYGVVNTKKSETINKIVNDFNDDTINALVLNTSNVSGISLHSSIDFKNKDKRVMFILQAEADISKELQKRGRVDRYKQVQPPDIYYLTTNIEIEKTEIMRLRRKMASIEALVKGDVVLADFKSEDVKDIQDVANELGASVMREILSSYSENNTDNIQRSIVDKIATSMGRPIRDIIQDLTSDRITNKSVIVRQILNELYVLDPDEQTQFMEEIISSYKEELSKLRAQGYMVTSEYDVLDLDAMPLSRSDTEQVLSYGSSLSSFEREYNINTYRVSIKTKKPDIIDIIKRIKKNYEEWKINFDDVLKKTGLPPIEKIYEVKAFEYIKKINDYEAQAIEEFFKLIYGRTRKEVISEITKFIKNKDKNFNIMKYMTESNGFFITADRFYDEMIKFYGSETGVKEEDLFADLFEEYKNKLSKYIDTISLNFILKKYKYVLISTIKLFKRNYVTINEDGDYIETNNIVDFINSKKNLIKKLGRTIESEDRKKINNILREIDAIPQVISDVLSLKYIILPFDIVMNRNIYPGGIFAQQKSSNITIKPKRALSKTFEDITQALVINASNFIYIISAGIVNRRTPVYSKTKLYGYTFHGKEPELKELGFSTENIITLSRIYPDYSNLPSIIIFSRDKSDDREIAIRHSATPDFIFNENVNYEEVAKRYEKTYEYKDVINIVSGNIISFLFNSTQNFQLARNYIRFYDSYGFINEGIKLEDMSSFRLSKKYPASVIKRIFLAKDDRKLILATDTEFNNNFILVIEKENINSVTLHLFYKYGEYKDALKGKHILGYILNENRSAIKYYPNVNTDEPPDKKIEPIALVYDDKKKKFFGLIKKNDEWQAITSVYLKKDVTNPLDNTEFELKRNRYNITDIHIKEYLPDGNFLERKKELDDKKDTYTHFIIKYKDLKERELEDLIDFYSDYSFEIVKTFDANAYSSDVTFGVYGNTITELEPQKLKNQPYKPYSPINVFNMSDIAYKLIENGIIDIVTIEKKDEEGRKIDILTMLKSKMLLPKDALNELDAIPIFNSFEQFFEYFNACKNNMSATTKTKIQENVTEIIKTIKNISESELEEKINKFWDYLDINSVGLDYILGDLKSNLTNRKRYLLYSIMLFSKIANEDIKIDKYYMDDIYKKMNKNLKESQSVLELLN